MALAVNLLPFGIRDIKLTPISAAGAYGSIVDLPAGRTLSWSETADFEELRGDDQLLAERETATVVDWELEEGGISLEAYAVMAGGTVTSSGVTPNVKKTYNKKGTETRPYFYLEGQSINDNGGDTHVVIYKAKATGDIGGEFSEGSFQLTSASGRGYPDALHADKIYDLVGNETAAAIVVPT